MKIGIDARFFGPDSKGLGRYTQKLITHLEHIDYENKYVIFLRKENFDIYTPKNKNFTKVIADYQWYSFAEQIFFPFTLYKYNCDIVHFPHFNVPLLYWKKFIVTIHDLILLKYPTKKASTRSVIFYRIKFFMYRIVIAYAVKKAVSIITVSNAAKEDICSTYKSVCDKTYVIYEAAEIAPKHVSGAENTFKKYGIMKPYMLYVGNAYPHKNLNKLVEAFGIYNQGNDEQLVLVGSNDYFYQKLRAYIKEKKLNNIIILHTISDEDLCALYERANFFVFPSLYEGFGLPPLEAQLYKIPVLSSDHKCMKEVLSVDGALYFDATDVDVFAGMMQKIATDKALRETLITSGYVNAMGYSWEKTAAQTHNIYKNNI